MIAKETFVSSPTRALVHRLVTEALSNGDFAVADALLAPDARFYTNLRAAPFIGPEGFRFYIGGVRAGIPDTRIEIHRLIVEDDYAFARWTLHGTHTGDLHGMPATGRKIALEAFDFFRIEDGQVAEIRLKFDGVDLLKQLGVMPAGDGVPAPLRLMLKARTKVQRLLRA